MNFLTKCIISIFCLILLSGCQSTTSRHSQGYIRNGMSSKEVVKALGSPNMVTRNPDGTETWVYDKIISNFKANKSNSGIYLSFPGSSRKRKSNSPENRTLTMVIHFNKDSRVADFSYRMTSF